MLIFAENSLKMKKYTAFINATPILIVALLVMSFISCKNDNQAFPTDQKTIGTSTRIEGDSTLYGLACDGCTDTVMVFLPGKGGDPVVYDILDATKEGRIIGRPQVGDWVAIIVNGEDTTKADMVIDLDQLKGTWVTKVMPTVRERIDIVTDVPDLQAEFDSLVAEQMKPIEMGFSLKRHYTAQAVGRRRAIAEDSPVVYPSIRNYTEWHVINGQLILTADTTAGAREATGNKAKLENDTADFIFMTRDSLRLRFRDGERGYYRKP